MRTCETCHAGLLTERRNARFCSSQCKDIAHTAKRRAEVDAVMAERRCTACGASLAGKRSSKAFTCGGPCAVTSQNRKRAARKLEAQVAADVRCAECGEPVPVGKRRQKFCSFECKHRHHGRRYRERYAFSMRERLYGVSESDFVAMLEAQDGRCAICRADSWGGKHGSPHVDHDHVTGKVRGLLCDGCNNGLGRFKDDPARLRAAATYLEAHASV